MSDQEQLTGRIDRVIYHNPASGFAVLLLHTPDGEATNTTAVGQMPHPETDTMLTLEGEWKNHPRFGPQFQFETFEVQMPADKHAIVKYLSTLVYGVGPVRAGRIVDQLGTDCLTRIQDDPELLRRAEINGVSEEQKEEVIERLGQQATIAEIVSLLNRGGVTPGLARRIYEQYGDESVQVLKANPYIVIDDMWGVGFKTADRMAMSMGIPEDSPVRILAAVHYVMKESSNDGHCYLTSQNILNRTRKVLQRKVSVVAVGEAVHKLTDAGEIVAELNEDETKTYYYLAPLHEAESKAAQHMTELLAQPRLEVSIPRAYEGIQYTDDQLQAIDYAFKYPLSIITGGPGTGKTTVTRAIVDHWQRLAPNEPVSLASPTGRAAKRLEEATGQPAQTVHRLLGYSVEYGFLFAEAPRGLLIVDEFSMADMELTHHFFRAIHPEQNRVVLVGDVDQLPSVGPGSVLRDSIQSGVVPTTRLDFNFRQGSGSSIAALAQRINAGEIAKLHKDAEIEPITVKDRTTIPDLVADYSDAAHKKHGILGFQALAPMKNGVDGVHSLNEAIRDRLNPRNETFKDTELRLPHATFRVGDKVMVIRNIYALGVFNGDLGQIVHINENAPSATVEFPEQEVTFEEDHLRVLQLAYASTVHKAQGSEFPALIVVCTRGHYIMLRRNLLYTAVSRAKQSLVLIYQGSALRRAVRNNEIELRKSRLRTRLQQLTAQQGCGKRED